MSNRFQRFYPLIKSLNPNDDCIIFEQKVKYLIGDIGDELQGNEETLK